MEVDKKQDRQDDIRDTRLLIMAQGGDSEAFGELWLHYKSRLHATARRRTKGIDKLRSSGQIPEKAEDIVHETFLIAWRRIDKIRPGAAFRPWLWGILRNCMRGQINRLEKPLTLDSDTLCEMTDNKPSPAYIGNENAESIFRWYISRLNEKHRIVLESYYFKEMTQAEIGGVLEISREAVRQRIKRAIDKLRYTMKKDGFSPEDF